MTLREDVLQYVHEKYKTEPEYLWRRFPRYAVLRHEDNRKWYGIIMDVPRENLGLHGKERVDILNVKLSDPSYADMLTRQEGYFKGYHISRGNTLLKEEYGICAIRGPRGIPHSLSEALK